MEKKLLFALDIGTRSVVGLVGEKSNNTINILAMERMEHHTRAMLDGQIHDVPEVAKIVNIVKSQLEKTCGALNKVSVAAAGRALYTISVSAKLDVTSKGTITVHEEQTLELTALQSAQKQLAMSHSVSDPAMYYCVGYSISKYSLDGTSMHSLIGQKGKEATIELIATFLPRQVIDSIQSALTSVNLEMETLTLEPIAAINILIPQTMRHLNLALIDVGAGTSDVAITNEGSVIGYGMVPFAGDEITEAISNKYLLDFKIAETIKRKLTGRNKTVELTDVLGMKYKISTQEIINSIKDSVGALAQAIAAEIIRINSSQPQAVLMVGGGSLTPMLTEAVAQSLDLPPSRVAVRRPDVSVEGFANIPNKLCTPDFVTPLGILKLAGIQALNFMNVFVNEQPLKLFNVGSLTVVDALLAAGIDLRSLHGKPGLAITITVNKINKFIPGTHGKPGIIKINGQKAVHFDSILQEGDKILVEKGVNGQSPCVCLKDLIDIPSPICLAINQTKYTLPPIIKVNQTLVDKDIILKDRDQVEIETSFTLTSALTLLHLQPESTHYSYRINDNERTYNVPPTITINGKTPTPTQLLKDNDSIRIFQSESPTLGELMGLSSADYSTITVKFNTKDCLIPIHSYEFTVNGTKADLQTILPNNSIITYVRLEKTAATVSDVLLAADFDPRSIPLNAHYKLLLNGVSTEYTSIVKNNDHVELIID